MSTKQPDETQARWYMVNKDGMATLCADQADAKQEAADAQAAWPGMGPHRAVQLVEAPLMGAAGDAGWRDHVEQRLLTWRQSFVNRSGDQLALDDFMDKQSIDDLIDFVCSEFLQGCAPSSAKGVAHG